MPKAKGGRGARRRRQGEGREGRKPGLSDQTLDTEMLDFPQQRSGRYKQTQKKSSSSQVNFDNGKRGRVAKATTNLAQTRQSIFSNASLDQQPSRTDSSSPAFSTQNPFISSGRPKVRRVSLVSCVSALSTKIGRRPYCYKCARTNRRLRQARFDLLDSSLKNGKKLIDEWAWEAGVSPDHMDCERTKLHTIPEGQDEPGDQCEGGATDLGQTHPMRKVSPGFSRTLGTAEPQLPSAEIHQPPPPQTHQKLNPFIPAESGAFGGQPSQMLAPQVHSSKSWSILNSMSMAEQTETYACYAGQLDLAPSPQAPHSPYQQHPPDHHSSHVCQVTNTLFDGSTHQHLGHIPEQPVHVLQQATVISSIPNFTAQESHGGHPLILAPQTSSIEDQPSEQAPQAQHCSFQHQPQPRSSHLEFPGTTFAKSAAAVDEEGQELLKAFRIRDDALVTPPPSYEMTIRGMLNNETCTGVGASSETTQQATGNCSGSVIRPDQEQQSPLRSPGQEQAPKYVGFHSHLGPYL